MKKVFKLHKDISIQCLEAGVHVLCEKPMALNVDDCDAMIAAAGQAGKHLMIAQCIRFWPEYVWVKQAHAERFMGDLSPLKGAYPYFMQSTFQTKEPVRY